MHVAVSQLNFARHAVVTADAPSRAHIAENAAVFGEDAHWFAVRADKNRGNPPERPQKHALVRDLCDFKRSACATHPAFLAAIQSSIFFSRDRKSVV